MHDVKPTYDELEQALIVEHRTTAALRQQIERLTADLKDMIWERDTLLKELGEARATLARVEGERCSKCGDTFPIHSLTQKRECPVAMLEIKLAQAEQERERLSDAAEDLLQAMNERAHAKGHEEIQDAMWHVGKCQDALQKVVQMIADK